MAYTIIYDNYDTSKKADRPSSSFYILLLFKCSLNCTVLFIIILINYFIRGPYLIENWLVGYI